MALSNKPTDVKCDKGRAWYYEDKPGIDIVVELQGYGPTEYVRVKIPWGKLRKSLANKDDGES